MQGDGFEIETLINIRVAKSPLIISEVASYESTRLHGVSNLNAVRDGLRVLRMILSERVRRSAASRRSVPLPAFALPYPSASTDSMRSRADTYLATDVA
jgi:hypothetical protein